MNNQQQIKNIQLRISSLEALDETTRAHAIKDSITDIRKLYVKFCKDYKKHFKGVAETRALKKACREVLNELREEKKRLGSAE